MQLGNEAIRQALYEKKIVIHPYKEEKLNPASYNITIANDWLINTTHEPIAKAVFKLYPYAEKIANLGEWIHYRNKEDGKMLLVPDIPVLAYTEEFIGSCYQNINTKLHTRSTYARNFISIHPSAGFGDPGYCSRWAIELTCQYPLLITDLNMGQVEFLQTHNCKTLYSSNYNVDVENWSIKNIIPKKNFTLDLRVVR